VLPEDVCLVIPGGSNGVERNGPVISLPHRSAFFHPDLVNAADAVMGKVGYSTLAEVYQAGVPFGFIKRSHFRESDILAEYIHQQMRGVAISEASFRSGAWEKTMEQLLSVPPREGERANGATQIADFVCDILDGKRMRAE
jgi:UDP-N-acetylglucosamine:LPS N-acetylglucosamine transferase